MTEQMRTVGGDTRREVMSLLLQYGPVTASEIGERLGLSAAGVRRHLGKLVEDGLAETCDPNLVAGEEATRGRPAQHYRLTEQGRGHFGHHYDAIAVQALDMIKDLGGPEAVREFARDRIGRILENVEGADTHADPDSEETITEVARNVASVLQDNGYAATVTRAGAGIQICQHHCPVSAVAAAHPEICEAEHDAISHLVGRHVQPLALISGGNGVCTTNIPLTAITPAEGNNAERSGKYD